MQGDGVSGKFSLYVVLDTYIVVQFILGCHAECTLPPDIHVTSLPKTPAGDGSHVFLLRCNYSIFLPVINHIVYTCILFNPHTSLAGEFRQREIQQVPADSESTQGQILL